MDERDVQRILAFDETVSFEQPVEPAKGIDTVIVNGEPVWREGRPTAARPGHVLTHAF
jgi:N-acyl-D-amino-acid deacylase